MVENLFVHLDVQKFLNRKKLTVADLVRRLQDNGFRFDKKTIYRLASDEPVQSPQPAGHCRHWPRARVERSRQAHHLGDHAAFATH